MTNTPDPRDLQKPQETAPVEVEGAPPEEGISETDVADRVDEEPEEQENLTDQDPTSEENTEDS